MTIEITAKSTILEFLQAGGRLGFPNGAELQADVRNNDIDLIDEFGARSGTQILNEEGLALALVDKDIFPGPEEEEEDDDDSGNIYHH